MSYFTRRHDGRPMQMASALIRDNTGQPIGFLAMNTDLGTPVLDFRSHYFSRTLDPSEAVVERFGKKSDRAPVAKVAGSPVKVRDNI